MTSSNWRDPENQLQKSQELVTKLNTINFEHRSKIETLTRRLAECEQKAAHMDILLRAIKENQVVKGAWDNFTMTLRLTGYDKPHDDAS